MIEKHRPVQLRVRLADRRIRQPGHQGHHRPDQGGSRGDPERSFGCGSPDHHRSHDRRTAEEVRRRRRQYAPGRRHGRHGFLRSPRRFQAIPRNAKPRQRCRGFCLGRRRGSPPATQLTPKYLSQRYGEEQALCSLGYPCYSQELRKYTFVCIDNFEKNLARESQTEPTVPFLLAQSSVGANQSSSRN